MTLAMIGRCDIGSGLANLTEEVFRHLKPERTLLLNMEGRGRGDCNPSLYDLHGVSDQQVYPATFNGELPRRAIDWLCAEGIDTLFSAETFYSDEAVLTVAHQHGIRTVCYAMPELTPWATSAYPDRRPRPRMFHLPTSWRAETLPDAEVLPFPVARDRFPFRLRERCDHFVHVTGKAMQDRNGTMLVLAALPHVTRPCRLTIRTEKPLQIPPTKVDVTILDKPARDYWGGYPEDADVLLLPRRYGGLSLPIQEVASLGMPAVILASDPYSHVGSGTTSLPSKFSHSVPMKGAPHVSASSVPIYDAEPKAIAAAMDYLVDNPEAVRALSQMADLWAEERSWDGPLGDRWRGALDAS